MINRNLSKHINKLALNMPVITITGPRQSGKTTFCKTHFKKHDYVNLENIEDRIFATTDPKGFLAQYKKPLIIDEAQYAPQLFSFIQNIVDDRNKEAQFVLSGSQNFLLLENIAQSLAGRVAIFYLLPLSLKELATQKKLKEDYQYYIFNGFYPRLYKNKIDINTFYQSYISTYIERDVKQLLQIQNLSKFQLFLKCIAGRIGQQVNFTDLSNVIGVDNKTIQKWFSVLEASFICFLLKPFHKNYTKRLVKTPKLYFYDTGLACSLLGINKAEEIITHWAKGALFENMIVADIHKDYFNKGKNPPLYYWRDNNGTEVDLIIENNKNHKAVEIKSGRTINEDFFRGIDRYQTYSQIENKDKYIIYGGSQKQFRTTCNIISWQEIDL